MLFRRTSVSERMEAACEQLLAATKDISAWEWDDTYDAVLAIIESPHESEPLATLHESLPHSWNTLDIRGAPEPVRHVSGLLGDLMAGQLLFVLDPEIDPMLSAAWWPWGNRLKSSLRISYAARSEAAAKTDAHAKLRASFDL